MVSGQWSVISGQWSVKRWEAGQKAQPFPPLLTISLLILNWFKSRNFAILQSWKNGVSGRTRTDETRQAAPPTVPPMAAFGRSATETVVIFSWCFFSRNLATSQSWKNGAPGSSLSVISGALQTVHCRALDVPLSATGAKKYFSRDLATSQSYYLKKSSPRTSRGAKEERQRQARKQVSIDRSEKPQNRTFF